MTDFLVLVANAGDGSISTFRLNDEGLERIAVTEGVTGCSTFAVDGDRNLVYAAVKPDATSEFPGVLTLALDRETGALTPRSRRDLPGGGMNYLALSHGGTVLLGASYGGGYGISTSVAEGVVSEPVSQVEFRNLHSVLPSADGRFAYFVSLGDDVIAQYGLGADARLDDLGTVAAPEGSGPRHLVLNDPQDAVYVLTEFSGEVLHYSRDTESGALALEGAASAVDPSEGLTHSRFGADPVAEHLVWGADLHVGDGVLWASERSASTLAPVRVAGDGSVSDATTFTETEPQPRGFAVAGPWLVAAGERSTEVALYAVRGTELELLQRVETGAGANWVRFV